MNFRDATGNRILHENTGLETGFSNFKFVESHYGSHSVMRRIFSLVRRHEFQSIVVDNITESDCDLLAEENMALRERQPDFLHSEVHRIAFFKCLKDQTPDPSQDFIGYVVFKKDFFSTGIKTKAHIYEAILKPFRTMKENYFVHCEKVYEINTTLGKFQLPGVLYAQQNDMTSVCAHVGLRTALGCVLPDGDVTYAQINKLIGVDHKTRLVGGNNGGLDPDDIENVLTGFGINFSKVVHEPTQKLYLPTDYQRDLYGFIESSWPALVGFELEKAPLGSTNNPRHIIPIVGHTFNEDTWMPNADRNYFGSKLSYYPSENWMSSYVTHDDNFGPYLCMPRHFMKQENFRLMYGLKREKTEYEAVDAEAAGFNFLLAISNSAAISAVGLEWYDRFVVFTKYGWLVLRTILVRRTEYISHLKKIRDRDGDSIADESINKLESSLPDSFWMVEAGAPELFAVSRRKFGEVLLGADKPLPKPLNNTALLAARLPGFLLFGGTLEVEKTALTGHTDLFAFE